jgi:hypothetical protein
MLLNLAHPVLNGTEALSVCDIVGNDNTVSALVVAAGDGLEALLAGGVPNLQLDGLAIDIDGPYFLKTRLYWRAELTKSTPIVGMKLSVNTSSANLSNREDFPTPEFPMSSTLNR